RAAGNSRCPAAVSQSILDPFLKRKKALSMSTLYVCDLDGTLLTPEAQLSPRTVTILNCLLERGLLFTVATARTPATANTILAPLHLRLPAVFLTGALVYDLRRMQTLQTVSFPPDTARCV